MPPAAAPEITGTLDTLRDAARAVLAALGAGHSEAVYHAALLAELAARRVPYRTEVVCPFMYKPLGGGENHARCVGHGRVDVVVENVAVEIKVSAADTPAARAQLARYVESLAAAERREFVGALLVLDRATARARLTAFDADGDPVYSFPARGPDPPAARAPDPEDDALMRAFRRRYKFSDASSTGVPLARLTALLARVARAPAVARFVRAHFRCRSEARRAGARRLVVCRPRAARGVQLVG
jgi:GxxExxY protein